MRRRADVFAAQRKFAEAETLLAKAQVDNVYPWIDRISVAADKGDWANAFRNLEAARKVVGAIEGDPIRLRAFAVTEASLLLASGKKAEAEALVPNELIDEVALVGPLSRIVERLAPWKAAGKRGEVGTMLLSVTDPVILELFAKELL